MTDDWAPRLGIYAAFIVGTFLLAAVLTAGAAILGTIALAFGALFAAARTSSIVATLRRRPAAGLRALAIQLGAGAGAMMGALVGLLALVVFGLPWPWWQAAGIGAVCGLASGGVLSVIAARMVARVSARIASRMSAMGGRIIDQ